MMQPIMGQFSIDASHFGIVAAFYYYGYAGMQIPVAMLLDRFSARTVIFMFAILCGLATILFTYSNHWYLACISRFLIGVGSAAGFLGVSKVVSEWFPKTQYTKMIGFSFTIGLLGAIYGGKPISLLIEHYYWKNIATGLAIASIVIAFGSLCCLRSSAFPKQQEEQSFQINHFKALLSSPIIWSLAIANLLMVGSLEGFSDVWGVPYLMTAYGISKANAAELISFVFFGMLLGGPLLSTLSNYLGKYRVISLCGIGMALLFAWLLSCHQYNGWLFAVIFFSIGIMCCYQVIIFAVGADLVDNKSLGVTVAFLNCINMLGGSFFHTIIGALMDYFWMGSMGTNGIKQYDVMAYHYALVAIPICAVMGAVIISILGLKGTRYHRLDCS
ncbi:MAG: MFS transporter [Legionella sp.]